MSNGEPEPVPSVIEQSAGPLGRVSPWIPRSMAALRMFGGPTSRASCANTTLIDRAVARYRSMYPRSPPPSALNGFHPLHGPDRSTGDFELYTFPGGMPSRNAATRVNGLNADPVWRLPQYPR